MPSILEGYNYDIFISYRQKDNKYDGWVTEFVDHLKKEIEATFKEDISIYFDENPHDGLLETHSVDKSLEEKLKCLIFIPVISQTYCDTKSFAWQHEFCAFNKLAKEDKSGRDIRLSSGNVASRILPVKIHDLDSEDKALLENELGGVLRCVEFIYKSPGVNRPLRANEDHPQDNLNKTYYRDQINKVANAVKEIITALKKHDQVSEKDIKDKVKSDVVLPVEDKEVPKEGAIDEGRVKKKKNTRKAIWIGSLIINIIFILVIINALKSVPFSERDWILITDFENLTGDDVFDLSLNTALEVTLQQSSFVNVFPRTRINETLKRMGRENTEIINEDTGIEIAQREGIAVIVVCNISLIGNVYLLTAKVVEVNTRKVLRTEKFEANGKNEVLTSLDELARKIRSDLGESLKEINREIVPLPEATTSSLEALKCLVKGNEAWNRDGHPDQGEVLFLKAIELDPEFALAYAYLGSMYYWRNNRTKGEEYFTKALNLSDRLTEKEKLWIQARVEGFRGNFEEAALKYNIYLRNYPSNPDAWYYLGYNYMMSDRLDEAISAFNKSLEIYKDKNPDAYINIATCYSILKNYPQAVEFYLKAFALNPSLLTVPNLNHEFGFTYVEMGELQKAREVFERMTTGKDEIKSRGYRALALLLMYTGKYSEAINQLIESIKINKTLGAAVSELRDRMFLATVYKAKRMMPEFYGELNRVNVLLRAEGMEPWWFFLYGKFLVRDGKIQKAESILNEISARKKEGNNNDKAAFNILKGEIELAKGNSAGALDLIEPAIAWRRDNYTLESLANYYYETGDLDKAISRYEEIISITNSLGWEGQDCWIMAHYNLGKLYEKKGNTEQALKYYQDFLNIWRDADEDIPVVIDAKSRLAKLRVMEP
jgi:tetratricopeptide (TPR) repeat protein